jgi:hypothetical protein
MEWQEIGGSWVLIPQRPLGIIHFLGGAFIATAPNITYRWLLEQLGQEGYAIVATPFLNTLDHTGIARSVLNRFENIFARLQAADALSQRYLPTYGLGHSMGCKLQLLIGSLFSVERAGNILISFNNYPVRRAVPFLEQLEIDTESLNLEFTPSPTETNHLIGKSYQIRRNLLIKFTKDEIDQTASLQPILQERFPDMVSCLTLPGNHLTPLGQEIKWQAGEVFSPLDAVGQWLKQTFSRDLLRLKQEILNWLNPGKMV